MTINLTNFPKYSVSTSEHLKRKEVWKQSGKNLKSSIEDFLNSPDCKIAINRNSTLGILKSQRFSHEFLYAHDEQFKNMPFGATNTVEKAGCLAFSSYHLLKFFYYKVSFEDVVKSIVSNGFRSWRFTKDPFKKTLTVPSVSSLSFKDILELYRNYDKVQRCLNINEALSVLGEPIGIGGTLAYFDALVTYLNPSVDLYSSQTRLQNIEDIFINLHKGCPIPIRVDNGIFYDKSSKAGGHYVLWLGIKDAKAIIIDSEHQGFSEIPIKRVLQSMITTSDPCLVAAINTLPLSKVEF